MIEVRDLCKSFGQNLAADKVSFEARHNAVTYLLGPNGAGKTTVMRMIMGLIKPDSGSILINGTNLSDSKAPISDVGVSFGAYVRNPEQTAEQHLLWQARLRGIKESSVKDVLYRVGLDKVAKRLTGSFSLGMLQRLGLASALLGDKKVMVLDEPSNGLDVEGTLWLRELFVELTAEGKCLLVASHNLPEVELTASWIVILGKGRVLASSEPDEIMKMGSGPRLLESAYLNLTGNASDYAGRV